MRAIRWSGALAVVIAGAVLAGSALAAPAQNVRAVAAAKPKLPVWIVTGQPITPGAADALMQALGTFDSGLQADGSILYVDPERFLALPSVDLGESGEDESGLPTQAEAVDLEAVRQTTVIGADEAIELAEGALADAVLEPLNGTKRVNRVPQASNSTFDAIMGEEQLSVPIDTVVSFDVFLGAKGIPLRGPGAETRFSFDGEGAATSVRYAHRSLRQGPNIVIINAAQALKQATAEYRNQCGQTQLRGLDLKSELVYYAPPLSLENVKRIMPAYEFSGRGQAGRETVDLRQILVPAAESSVRARISANADGRFVSARALVTGGAPPYSFAWESCSTPLDPASTQKQAIGYDVAGREGLRSETLILHVTDANGMTASARATLQLPAQPQALATQAFRGLAAIGPVDVGAESVGTAQGLPGCNADVGGFKTRMALNGIPTQFFWTNLAAWEQDFKDPSKPGGDDNHYADDVDATMYCGHANGDGFTFPGAHGDGFLHYNDAFWGNRDLEWLGIAACGPLQTTSGGLQWWQRWQPAFGGLHLLLGYETTSFDVTGEGWDWANGMLGNFWWGAPLTVRQAWIQMAINNQPSSVRWAVMGVFGTGGTWNWNDYFWGKGPSGPDIGPGSITGSWKLSGPA
jgi:hypothetical protein